MNLSLRLGSVAIAAAVAFGSTARAADDIVDTAVGAGSFKTLVAAVKAAELVEALKGEGPFTVFAPTDDAFAKLPEGTVESLLEDPAKLRAILKYHVVSGKVPASKVVGLKEAKTLNGQSVSIEAAGTVKVDNATVVQTDIECANGIIHVIDSVILPADDIVDVAAGAGQFNTLLAAVGVAGLTDTLRGEGPFTVFAPTDAAFAALPEGTVEGLLAKPEDLAKILTYHVVAGKVPAEKVVAAKSLTSVEGSPIAVSVSTCSESHATTVTVAGATVVKTDIEAANGIIHVIDAVITP